jgi:transposase-like protein
MGGRRPGDYPKTIAEFHRRFPDDEACLRYLVETRWPDGFRCPGCGSANARLLTTRRLWQCRACRRQTSATAGTVLHRTRLPLTAWFSAAYLMTSLKPGISALQLQRQLGLVSFGTTWVLLHKLRRAMVNPDRRKLAGSVEVDETWIGGKQAGLKGGRQRRGRKALLVAVAVERREKALGRLRLEVVPDASQLTLGDFIARNVEPGSTIISDAWPGYDALDPTSYTHLSLSQAAMKRAGVEPDAVPGVHRVISNLEDLAARHAPRRRGGSSRPLPRRVRVPLQPALLPHGRVRHPARSRNRLSAHNDRAHSLAALGRCDQPATGPGNRPHQGPLLDPDHRAVVIGRRPGRSGRLTASPYILWCAELFG